jgi:flagellar FliL protein
VAAVENAPAPKSGPSIIIQIAVLLVMTGAAVGIGWLSGSYLNSTAPQETAAANASPVPDHEASAAGGHGEGGGEGHEGEQAAGTGNPLVLNLGTITTNLAAPSDTWLRLELSVVLDQPTEDPLLAQAIQQDLLAFMRTVKLHQIEGASGFQHLKSDLLERASIRSDGHVKAVLVRTMLFE